MTQKKLFNTGADTAYNNDEHTPPEIYMALGPIDGDPCAGEGTAIGSVFNWTKADDGLFRKWPKKLFLFVNPPFCDPSGKLDDGEWKKAICDLCRAHGNCILLLPWSAAAEWQQYILERMDSVFVPSSRVKFMKPGSTRHVNAKFSTALFAFGGEASNRLAKCGLRGTHLQRYRAK